MKKLKFYNLFYIFIICSIFGWVIEGLWTFLKKGVLINHSALVIGPFNIIYGICACLFSILLIKYKNSPSWKIFLFSFFAGSLFEYLASLFMEYTLGFVAWDYSAKFLNINGRIAIMYSFFWGILGVLWIKYGYDLILKLIEKINLKIGKVLMIILSVFLLFDTSLTYSAIHRAREHDRGIAASNSYERFLDKTFNSKYLKNMFNNNWK